MILIMVHSLKGYRSCVVAQQQVNVEVKKVLSALNKVKTILKKKCKTQNILDQDLSDMHKLTSKKTEQCWMICGLLKAMLYF